MSDYINDINNIREFYKMWQEAVDKSFFIEYHSTPFKIAWGPDLYIKCDLSTNEEESEEPKGSYGILKPVSEEDQKELEKIFSINNDEEEEEVKKISKKRKSFF